MLCVPRPFLQCIILDLVLLSSSPCSACLPAFMYGHVPELAKGHLHEIVWPDRSPKFVPKWAIPLIASSLLCYLPHTLWWMMSLACLPCLCCRSPAATKWLSAEAFMLALGSLSRMGQPSGQALQFVAARCMVPAAVPAQATVELTSLKHYTKDACSDTVRGKSQTEFEESAF